jgi:hypothetical protein
LTDTESLRDAGDGDEERAGLACGASNESCGEDGTGGIAEEVLVETEDALGETTAEGLGLLDRR